MSGHRLPWSWELLFFPDHFLETRYRLFIARDVIGYLWAIRVQSWHSRLIVSSDFFVAITKLDGNFHSRLIDWQWWLWTHCNGVGVVVVKYGAIDHTVGAVGGLSRLLTHTWDDQRAKHSFEDYKMTKRHRKAIPRKLKSSKWTRYTICTLPYTKLINYASFLSNVRIISHTSLPQKS